VSKSINKIPKGWERIPVGEYSKPGDRFKSSLTGRWKREADTTLVGSLCVPFIRAVKLPAKPKAKQAGRMRRESRVSRIATVIQRAVSGQIATAMEAAREVERFIDNGNRKKRRARK